VTSSATSQIEIIDPTNTKNVIGLVPQTPEAEFNAAVANAKDTFDMWKDVPTPQRVRYMMKYR